METLEVLARNAALQGSLVSRAAARASLDAGTTGHNLTEAAIWTASSITAGLKCPPYIAPDGRKMFMAAMAPDLFYDLIHGGNVVTAALYQDKEILFNGELGQIANFKLIVSPWAKIFAGAGAVNASSSATTLNGAVSALDKTMIVTSSTNDSAGRFLNVGTIETGATSFDDTERVRYISGTTTVTLVGSGANGGLRFDHASGVTVNNSDTVYPVAFGSPYSLVKVFAKETGEFGELVGPLEDGLARQWQSLAFKWFGGYGRMAENYLLRGEYSSSLDNI